MFPQTLYKSECHQRWIPWGKKKNMKKWNWGNSDYDAFPSHELQVAFGNIVTLHSLK